MLKNIFTNICTSLPSNCNSAFVKLEICERTEGISPPATRPPLKAAHAHANCNSPNNQVSDSDHAVLGCDFQPWHC